MMEFGEKLRRLMRDQRYSQEMLAQRLDVSQNLISLWSRGRSFPDIRQARELASIFGVSLDYLADSAQDEPPSLSLSEAERKVWEIVREIGPELAWRRLVGSDIHSLEPRFIPPHRPKIDRGDTG